MLNILYTIIIYPLVQIIEIIFWAGYKIFKTNGLAVICVSFAVTFLCLPLYITAEKWQKIERGITRRLKPKIDKIKAVFSSDEQYMILSTYYRQSHYHPLYGLRGSLGLLIQIPFFIAAYTFLSHLDILKGSSFFFIRDLGAPDGLLLINNGGGGGRFNILPLIMTLINCAAGAIYSKNLYIKDKVQIYGLALAFLVLLYNSPSGLVLYWTMNNIFSLVKNIFYLFKKPARILYITMCALALLLDIFLIFFHHGNMKKRIMIVVVSFIIPFIPFAVNFFNYMFKSVLLSLNNKNAKNKLFFVSLGVTCLLIGFVIPSYVIASSPQEFSYIESVSSPFFFLRNTFLQALGFSVFWPVCIYFLFGEKIKTLLTIIAVFAGYSSLVNAFCFSGKYGELSSMLTFVNAGTMKPSADIAFVNIFIMLVLAALIVFLIHINKTKIVFAVSFIVLFAFAGISTANCISIGREFTRYTSIRSAQVKPENSGLSPVFHLSQKGKNVIIIMLDRAVNAFVPEIFSESPELYKQFSGFVYYPNTLSFNGHTLIGAPPLFGGYEYIPQIVNERIEEPLVKKHNESLLLMPLIFSGNDFNVTITDPPWANYSWMPDVRIYDGYPQINVHNTIRSYTDIWLTQNVFSDLQPKSKTLQRNFILFSFFKSAPLVMRPAIYNNGDWWSTDSSIIDFRQLLNNYAALDFLPLLTDTKAVKQNTFTVFVNELTHEPAFLQAPDYVPVPYITERGTSKYAGIVNYPANASALKRLGTWFNYLKQNGVYDNTRIIIAADHGADINSGMFPYSENIPFNREIYNPLLLVKDFGDNFPLKTDNAFMTNADVPSLAFKNLIQNPVNPFTNNPVNDAQKNGVLHITISDKWMPYEHNANTFKIAPNEWYTVHSDIFNIDNWQKQLF
ncbi:MAG: YidC/Oxa1 family membrane protein insertase [Treponema sp.]|jgi:YidC/Oxa1 family membrane protein insertase|nr:YidC/Oxa1 family membrane protein insertase [Treponema sp.]